MVEMKQISRVGSRADRLNTDMGSVARKPENFACKDASRRALPQCSFASFGVSLRALSGASCDASEEVSVSRPRRYLEQRRRTGGYVSDKFRMMLFMCSFLPALWVWAAGSGAMNDAKSAAERGDAAAQFHYAEMLRDGRGVKKNVLESVTWTRMAADGGHAAAQCQMGLFYMNGLGVDRDEDKAVEWLKKAAAQNHAQAQYNLGIYYAKFSDNEACKQAVKWLKEAVKQDYADAEFNLAKLYLNPHHPASREQGAGSRAFALLRHAAAQNHAAAKELLEELGIK